MPVKPGALLGRYRLVSRAGTGGMSEVWKAEDETLHRTVAVKVILDPIAADAAFTERFLREARLVAGLEHPNVLPVFDFGTAEVDGRDVSFLVMPLVPGGSLKERIRGPAPFGQAVAWLGGIAEALDHAHAKGILHRDVKPGNVLLDGSGRPLLSDFGLARTADSASGLTATGTVLGTPSYMAPEQATGQALDGRADQYALAVIAFELLTGRVPFRADSPLGVLHQHVSVPPAALTTVVSGIPAAADDVMHRALAKDRAARFATCAEFVAALGVALGVSLPAAPTQSPRPVPPPIPPSPPGREPSRAATVVTGPSLPRPAEAMAAPASRPPQPVAGGGTGRAVLLSAAVVAALAVVAGAGWLFLRPRPQQPLGSASPPPAIAEALPAEPVPVTEASATSLAAGSGETGPAPVTTAASALPQEPAPAALAPSSSPEEAPAPSSGSGPSGGAKAGSAGSLQRPPARAGREASLPQDVRGTDGPLDAPPPEVLPRREPLLAGSVHAADTSLSAAFATLDTTRKPAGRLSREDFASALGDAREVLSRRASPDARFLDAYCRGGVSFASGDTQNAWELLMRALGSDSAGASQGRVLSFVASQVSSLGRNPGPDAGWVLGLAFADVRGDLDDELERAGERAPDSTRVAYARALRAVETRQGAEARRWARRACEDGLEAACDLLGPRTRGRR